MKGIVMKALGLTAFLLVVGLVGGWESKYSRLATCTGFVKDVYTFTDNSGEMWEWEKEKGDDFQLGYVYRLVMDDNHTTIIEDDWIYKIKKN